MKKTPAPSRYVIVRISSIKPVSCPCGLTRRALVDDPGRIASLHQVSIKADSRVHFHKRLTEIYYILKGRGRMELDGRSIPVRPGDAVLIKPGCRHRAVGPLTLLNLVVPAFDARDEWCDEVDDMQSARQQKGRGNRG